MAYYVNGTLISGANTLPKMTMAEYLALPVSERPTYWECTDKDYDEISAENVSYGSGTVKDALDIEDITSQCTVNNERISSIGTFRVLKQGHLVMIYMGNFRMVAAGDNQGYVVTGLPKAAEQGSSLVSGANASASAAINASGTVCWIAKGYTNLNMHVGNVTNYSLWTNLFYFCE